MRILLTSIFCVLAISGFVFADVGVDVGDTAPDFTLPDIRTGEDVSLADFRGQVVVLQMWKCN